MNRQLTAFEKQILYNKLPSVYWSRNYVSDSLVEIHNRQMATDNGSMDSRSKVGCLPVEFILNESITLITENHLI